MAGDAAGIGEVKIGGGKRSLLEDPREILRKQRGNMGGIARFAKRGKVSPNQKRDQGAPAFVVRRGDNRGAARPEEDERSRAS